MASVKKNLKNKKTSVILYCWELWEVKSHFHNIVWNSMQENRPAGNLSMHMSAVRTDTNEHREQEFILRKKILYLCKSCKLADAESH